MPKRVKHEEIMRRYVFLGPQGSGKGTQAAMLARVVGVPHLSTGEILRQAIDRQTLLGRKVKDIINSGDIVEDDDVNAIVAEIYSQKRLHRGYILDGYPRTFGQAEYLEILGPPDKVILLELSDDEAVRRIAGRRTCSVCRAMYHLDFVPPKTEGRCDKCGGSLLMRDDDKEEAVRERLRLYHFTTEPLIGFYADSGRLIRVDGRLAIDEVHKRILQALKP